MRNTGTILLATSNPGKSREMRAVLNDLGTEMRWLSLADLSKTIPEPEENGMTFAANAALKAAYYSRASRLWTIADDSGLEVDALDGEPGVRSARYADDVGQDSAREIRDPANNQKLIAKLQGIPPERRTARFRCALALADGDHILATADGTIEGVIIDAPRGSNGFGYDPHFFLPELGVTTAELDPNEKNRISHRGKALRALAARIAPLLD